MNISERNHPERSLNYYSRSSPRHRHHPRPLHSPLAPLTSNPPPPPRPKTYHLRHSLSTFTPAFPSHLQFPLHSHRPDIYIQEEDQPSSQPSQPQPLPSHTHPHPYSPSSSPQKGDTSLDSLEILVEEAEEWTTQNWKNNGSHENIRIEEDSQEDSEQLWKQNQMKGEEMKGEGKPAGRAQGQIQGQGMNRQYTFGQEFMSGRRESVQKQRQLEQLQLIVSEKAESDNSITDQVDNPRLKDMNQQNEDRYTPVASLLKLTQEDDKKSSELPLKEETLKLKTNPKNLMLLIEEDSDTEPPDYNSPKFNLQAAKEHPNWQKTTTAQHSHSPDTLYSIEESAKEAQRETSSRSPSSTHLRRSTLERPYGHSILSLSELLPLLSPSLQPAYQQVHRKLITDQIIAEQRLEKQQATIGIMVTLRELQARQLQCEQYLCGDGEGEAGEVAVNQLLLRAMVRRLAKM